MKTNFTLAWLLIFVTSHLAWSQRQRDSSQIIYPKALSIGGGGRQIGLILGALSESRKFVNYSEIKVVTANSAGCLGALAFLLNYSNDEIYEMWRHINLKEVRGKRVVYFSPFSIYDGKGIMKLVEMMLNRRGYPSNITMQQLSQQLDIKFYFMATLIDRENKNPPISIALGDSIYNQIPVALAVQISSAVPNYIRGFSCNETATIIDTIFDKHARYNLIDGNFFADNNFPLRFATKKICSKDVLGFYVSNEGKAKEMGILSIISYNLGKKNDRCIIDSLKKNSLTDKAILLNAMGICSPLKGTSAKRLTKIFELGKQQAEMIFQHMLVKKTLASSPPK